MPTRFVLFGVEISRGGRERKRLLLVAATFLLLLVALEWTFRFDVSLGILYTFPVAIAAMVFSRKQILLLAVACAFIRGQFTTDLSPLESFLRFLMATIAYGGAGLLVVEMSTNRRRLIEHYARLRMEQDLRRKAEEQLRILAESSPAAILTLNSEAVVVAANRAAHEMFSFEPNTLVDQPIEPLFPVFKNALELSLGRRHARASVTGWARRKSGTMFPVQAWFSTYGENGDRALAAILVDMSEEVRDRDLEHFRHIVDHNRLLAGAVSHEIRNLCSAIRVVSSNLRRQWHGASNPDFDALQSLVEGLSQIASFDLRSGGVAGDAQTEVAAVLDELRVVIEPDWGEIDGEVRIHLPENLPPVHGDPFGLMQVFLNLSQNSSRAVADCELRQLDIVVEHQGEKVILSFRDSGPGIPDPSHLFQPFRPDADGTGLGLYISRTLARRYGGDLIHIPTPSGCRFDVILAAARPGVTELTNASG